MAVTTQLTLDAFLRQPEQKPALEFERGVITQKMAAMARHGRIQVVLSIWLEQHGDPKALVRAFAETRVTWPVEGVSYVPDVIAYRVERVPMDAVGEIPDHLFAPPDVAVEIASPGQALTAQQDRCRWYVAHGVPVALLVHPDRRAVWTFRAGAERGPLQDGDRVDLGDVIAGCSFTVAQLFASLRARPS